MMDRTRAAHLIPRGLAGDEAEQVEDVSQSDPSSDFGELNTRHDCALRDRDRRLHMRACHAARVWYGVGDREEEPVILYIIIQM
jgi:hypothetical protein